MPHLTIDGVKLFYRDEGDGLPVVLLHGFPFNGDSFRPQLEALTGKYRLIVPDHRGFGRSEPGEGPLTMTRIAEDALALLTHLGIESAVFGGVSMGGYATMEVVRADAGRVRGLVLVDTQPGADDEAGKQRREETAVNVLQRGVGVLVESMLPKLLAPDARPELKAEVEAIIRSTSPEGAAAASRGMGQRHDSREILARFSGPALIVVGEKDPITPPEKARQMAELIAGSKLVQLPGVAHLSNQEAPEAFNRELDAFLSTLPWAEG